MSKGAVLILGARSDIGRAMARRFAALGHPIQLAARAAPSLEAERADLEVRHGVSVSLHEFDALAVDGHAAIVVALPELPEVAVSVGGLMGQQVERERRGAAAARVIRSNHEGPASILAGLAKRFEARRAGTLVGVSSVAGELGRASNYVYVSAKAGLTAFLSGLRNRLAWSGVHMVTVLPGFVATQMTEGMDLPPRLTAQPNEVAVAISEAVVRLRDVVYVRPIWRLVMMVIRGMPERVFKRTRI